MRCVTEGKKVGLLKIRVFRPFPTEDVAKALAHVKRVAVLDKNISLGAKGAVALEVKDALYGSGIPVKGLYHRPWGERRQKERYQSDSRSH